MDAVPGRGVSIRVGGGPSDGGARWRRFVPGRCVAFDDSFEHEVRHAGRLERANLVVQLPHPDLAG